MMRCINLQFTYVLTTQTSTNTVVTKIKDNWRWTIVRHIVLISR